MWLSAPTVMRVSARPCMAGLLQTLFLSANSISLFEVNMVSHETDRWRIGLLLAGFGGRRRFGGLGVVDNLELPIIVFALLLLDFVVLILHHHDIMTAIVKSGIHTTSSSELARLRLRDGRGATSGENRDVSLRTRRKNA